MENMIYYLTFLNTLSRRHKSQSRFPFDLLSFIFIYSPFFFYINLVYNRLYMFDFIIAVYLISETVNLISERTSS